MQVQQVIESYRAWQGRELGDGCCFARLAIASTRQRPCHALDVRWAWGTGGPTTETPPPIRVRDRSTGDGNDEAVLASPIRANTARIILGGRASSLRPQQNACYSCMLVTARYYFDY